MRERGEKNRQAETEKYRDKETKSHRETQRDREHNVVPWCSVGSTSRTNIICIARNTD